MKAYVQWTRRHPADYERIDTSEWTSLEKLPEPTERTPIRGDDAGWVYALNIQGTVFSGYDHYAVGPLGDLGCRITVWIDTYPTGMNYARVMDLLPLWPDPHLGGSINTRGRQIVYAQPRISDLLTRDGPVWSGNGPETAVVYRPHEQFRPPPDRLIRHGKWVQDGLVDVLDGVRTSHSWREWTEGVPRRWVDDGLVTPGRTMGEWAIPVGTKTFGLRNTDQVNGIHATSDPLFENQMTRDAFGAGELESENLSGGGSELTHLWSTLSTEPNDAAWPTGDYRCQMDASTIGADVTFGLRTAGAQTGHFARVNSGLTSDLETKVQIEALFGAPAGDKLATTGSISWGAGSTDERFECLLAATRAANHGNQPLEMRYDASAFADGPWEVAAPSGQILVIPMVET